MSPRFAPVAALSLAAIVVAACSGAVSAPLPTQSPRPPSGEPSTPPPTALPDAGDVEGTYPELSVVIDDDQSVTVTLADPSARAWRVAVSGTGAASQDRLEVLIETGDVIPTVEMHEIRAGQLVDVVDLSATLDGEASGAAGGCHATLPVCFGSDGVVRLAADDDGTVSLRFELPEQTPLVVTGATAGWPGEPFILGPWTETRAFDWPNG